MEGDSKEEKLDFQICARVLTVCQQTSLFMHNQERMPLNSLEHALLSFCQMFKTHVLCDPRVMLLVHASDDYDPDPFDDHQEGGRHRAYDQIASWMNQNNILNLMEIIANKLIMTLMRSNEVKTIDLALTTLDLYVTSVASCRMFVKLDIIKQLIEN